MVLTLIYLKMRLISFLGILVMTGNVNKFLRGHFSICFNSHQFQL